MKDAAGAKTPQPGISASVNGGKESLYDELEDQAKVARKGGEGRPSTYGG